MLVLSCSACQKKLSVKEDAAGKKVKCPTCGQVFAAPDESHAPTLEPPTREWLNDETGQPARAAADAGEDEGVDLSAEELSPIDLLAPPQAPDELGRLGKYRVLDVLGKGGMGVVFKAEDPKLKRLVAIKAMLPSLAENASASKRFLREAETMAAVEHDHIVRIYQVDEDRGVAFFAMEFLQGEPLDKRLQREGALPPSEILRICREIAEGLAAAHRKGLIHRDIKPGNIWLEAETGRVKIVDFGLARQVSQEAALTVQGSVMGTPAYMSPEQGRGETVDARTDLWSLGVVLYRLCTGRPPFPGHDTMSTLMALADHEPPAPCLINDAIPIPLNDLIVRLLEKDLSRRLAKAEEVIERLRALEIGASATAVHEAAPPMTAAPTLDCPITLDISAQKGRAEKSPVWRSRFPILIAAVAVLAVLAFAILAGVLVFWPS